MCIVNNYKKIINLQHLVLKKWCDKFSTYRITCGDKYINGGIAVYNKYIKRTLDALLSTILFLLTSPLFLILCVLVKFNLGSPIFFRQNRSGKDKNVFQIIKFRTMTDKRDENGELLPDEMRQTKFGRILRSTSLDELPQLLNIIRGNMSIIGPRPLPPVYNDYYIGEENLRFEVRSGLIPPDVLFNSIQPTWDEQFKHEVYYAKNISFVTDLKVFFAVFKALFSRYNSDYGEYVRHALYEERSNVKAE